MYQHFQAEYFKPRLTESIFVTQLTKVGWLPPPQIFKMNHGMMLILVPMVSLESPLELAPAR